MNLAIFDLDNTLLADDSDFLWGQFLVKRNWVDANYYESKNQFFYDQYKAGSLDINEFLQFSLKPLSEHNSKQLDELHKQFMSSEIIPLISNKAKQLIKQHRDSGDYLLIITATNLFVTEPIANYLGMDDIIATIPEKLNGQYTGKVSGIPSFQEGKVKRLQQWLSAHPELSLNHPSRQSFFYSDSINDLPLLEKVTHPIAVDPDDKLKQQAITNNWKIISLR
ncbi:MAG: HAD family hydrolase [Pseudomonadota bacterium]